MQAGNGWVLQLEVTCVSSTKNVMALLVDVSLLNNRAILHGFDCVCNPAVHA